MKKLLIAILSIVMTLAFSLSLTACGKSFTATFIVDGETYATSQITKKESLVIPSDPVKANHTFNGWYLDDGVWQEPVTEETAETMEVTEDFNIYAYFTLNTIEGVTFDGATFTYDGTEKKIEVVGLPEGASVDYSPSNAQTDAGVYEITATITKENFETKTLTATLTINKKEMTGITFTNKRVFSGTDSTITATGYPEGATVTYTDAGPFNTKGSYTIGVKIELDNYVTYENTAVLTIVDAKDVVAKSYAGRSQGGRVTGSGGGQSYYLCVFEFNDDYTKANLYATWYYGSTKVSDTILNTDARVYFKSNGNIRIEAQWDGGYGFVWMDEDGSAFTTYSGHDRDYWDHVVAEGFEAKPRMYAYSGKYALDLSSYSNGDEFNPKGWKVETLNAQGEYEVAPNNAKIVKDDEGTRISLKMGESTTATYRYTYKFSDVSLGDFMFYTFGFKNTAAIRVRFLYDIEGYGYYILGNGRDFYDNGAFSTANPAWIYGTNGISRVVGIQIEVCKSSTYASVGDTIELMPFTLSYAIEA